MTRFAWFNTKPERARAAVVLVATCAAAAISYYFWAVPHPLPSDFTQVWAGSRALLRGDNPYLAVGPNQPYWFGWRPPYPLPAFFVGAPFAPIPKPHADALFAGVSSALLAWGLTRERWNDPRLLVFASPGYLHAVQSAQWSPILTAAAVLPPLSFVWAAKPTVGAALWCAYPSWRAVILIGVLYAVSFLVQPLWVPDWLDAVREAPHFTAPVQFWGGPLILLALTRWRLPEARLLATLACVPQSTFLYEAVPLFLIVKRAEEGAVLCAAMLVAQTLWAAGPRDNFTQAAQAMGQWMVWLVYLPCLIMVLRRRPEQPLPRAAGAS